MIRQISIRQKLTATHAGLTFVLLSFLGFVSFLWFANDQEQKVDGFLQGEMASIIEDFTGFWTEYPRLEKSFEQKDFHDYLLSFWFKRVNRPLPYKTTIFVLDDRGMVVDASNRALNLSIQSDQSLGNDVFSTHQEGATVFRMLTSRFEVESRTIGYVRLACLLADKDSSVARFGLTLAVLLFTAVLVSSLLGALLIGRALRPVAAMAAAAARISDASLSDRLPEPPGQDEIRVLAATLNSLLDRLETGRTFQEQLIEDLTHQLRTPLTVIRGRNEAALNKKYTGLEFNELLGDNLADVDQVVSLLNTMLSLARTEGRLEKIQKVPADLTALMRDLVDELQPLWDEKELTFRVLRDGRAVEWDSISPLVISMDSFMTRQALMNVLDNTYRFAPQGSPITVEFAAPRAETTGAATVTVTNLGPPIPPESLELIFKRFYRVPGSPESQGFGLGLSIAKSLMKRQGGNLAAFNPLEGGAGFRFFFPE